jgi:hypothetical protein
VVEDGVVTVLVDLHNENQLLEALKKRGRYICPWFYG